MGKPKFYGVARGRAPGVYATWDEARAQVDGIKGAVHAGRRLAPRNSMSNPSVPGLLSFFFLFLAFLSSPAVAHPNYPGGCSALTGHGVGGLQ